jgi:hypothetical protein
MLDPPEGVWAGQAPFEYPATSVLFSNLLSSVSIWRGADRKSAITTQSFLFIWLAFRTCIDVAPPHHVVIVIDKLPDSVPVSLKAWTIAGIDIIQDFCIAFTESFIAYLQNIP